MGAALPFVGPALSLVAAKQASDIGKFNEKVANRNAVIAKQEADQISKLKTYNINKFNQSFENLQSTTKVRLLKSGVELSGTALKILQSNAEQAELQRGVIEYNANVAASKKLEEANFAFISGQIARRRGDLAAIGYASQAGTSLLTMRQIGLV
tara:strand:- start:6034 stop:6495 length:462 start_codon:yes stop_codon:yes gene_type:complete